MKTLPLSYSGICGIYQIRNCLNGRVYIGSSNDLRRRSRDHLRGLKANKHSNRFMQNDWNKSGSEFFVFEVLEENPPEGQFHREQVLLDQVYDNQVMCYNFKRRVEQQERSCFSHTPKQTSTRMSEAQKRSWNQNYNERAQIIKKVHLIPGIREKFSTGQRQSWATNLKRREALRRSMKERWSDPSGTFRTRAHNPDNWVKGSKTRTDTVIRNHQELLGRHRETVLEWTSQPKGVGAPSKRVEGANLLSPDGVLFVNITNIQAFSDTFELSESKVRDVIKLKLLTHRGWTKFVDLRILENRNWFEVQVGKMHRSTS